MIEERRCGALGPVSSRGKGETAMGSPIVGGLLAFLGGCAVSALNYGINLRVLKRRPAALASMSIVREILSVVYLAAAYLLANVLPWGYVPLLVGAALGLTIPSIFLSFRLAKINDALSADAEGETSSGKGADQNE